MSNQILPLPLDLAIKNAKSCLKRRRAFTQSLEESEFARQLLTVCNAADKTLNISHEFLKQSLDLDDATAKSALMLVDAKLNADKYKRKQRKNLHDDLIKARSRLSKLKRQIAESESILSLIDSGSYVCDFKIQRESIKYPNIPTPSIFARCDIEEKIPKESGVYFIWHGNDIVYVGQSVNLYNRLSSNHGNIKDDDMISFIRIDEHLLDFTEAFYIGICFPERNFGKSSRYATFLKTNKASK